MRGPSCHVLTIALTPAASSLYAHVSARVARASTTDGLLSAGASNSVDLGTGPSPGASDAMVGRSTTSLVPVTFALSHPCAVWILNGSAPGGISDAGAPDSVTLSRQFAVARQHRGAALRELVSPQSELYQVRDENDELRPALARLRILFHKSRSSLPVLVSRRDAETLPLPSSDEMRNCSF